MSRPLRVLVVDDNKDYADTTTALLRMDGYDAEHCYHGLDAYDCVTSQDPDVVLLDVRMPGKNGWDVARQIRESIPGKRPMIIGITGEHFEAADRTRAESVGFDYYLRKPVDPDALIALIETARSYY